MPEKIRSYKAIIKNIELNEEIPTLSQEDINNMLECRYVKLDILVSMHLNPGKPVLHFTPLFYSPQHHFTLETSPGEIYQPNNSTLQFISNNGGIYTFLLLEPMSHNVLYDKYKFS